MRAPGTPLFLLLLAASAWAGATDSALNDVREGLLSPGRGTRDRAEQAAREIARTDPFGVAALFDRLDLEGKCLLVRALASAGTRHAADLALTHAGAPEPDLFRALLDGLAAGGEASLFADAPEGLAPSRLAALEELRLRFRLEAELVKLKSSSGPTGHYEGQYKGVKALGPAVIPILFDITMDRARPLPGESAAGPYVGIHPGMTRFDPQELRLMAAYSFGEIVERTDHSTITRLKQLYDEYRWSESINLRFEREDIAPFLAYALFDLGDSEPVDQYIESLKGNDESVTALWDLGFACIRVGRFEEGVDCYEKVIRQAEGKALAAYNLACNFSMRAAEEEDKARREWFRRQALIYLERSIREFNYGDWKWMEEDGDLAFIRKEPRYQAMLRFLQQKYPEREKGTVRKGRSALDSK